MYALVADGHNGLSVIQLMSPENVPGHMGFSPKPNPKLIATYPTHGTAVSVSRGLDRDRAVDESGNQTVVFGRRGSRPFHLDEMDDFFRRPDGSIYKVSDVSYGEREKLRNKDGEEFDPPLYGNHTLMDARKRPLVPTLEFKVPESAGHPEQAPPLESGGLKKRRAPKGIQ